MFKLYKKYVSVLLIFGMLCVGNISYAAAKGDVNGDGKINILDATMVLNYVKGKISSIDKKAADVNNDGVVNILDATKLLNVVKGKDTLEDPSDVGRISDNQAKELLFNAVYYANSYPDLKKAFGYDSAKLYEHYYRYGIKEGRSASPVFDPKYYLNNNADLKRAFGNDYKAAYNHWIEWGCSEGRESSQYYSGKYYKNKYGDLQRAYFSSGNNANNYYKLAKHYLEWGINEKRQANIRGLVPNNMKVIEYKNSTQNVAKYKISTNGGNLNVRSGPSTNYSVIGKIGNNSVVVGYEETNGWRRIEYNSGVGYVSSQYLINTTSLQTGNVKRVNVKSNAGYYYPLGYNATFGNANSINNNKPHDYGAAKGTPVYAPFAGHIRCYQRMANVSGKGYITVSYGNIIYLTSGNKEVRLCHLDAFEGIPLKYPNTQHRADNLSATNVFCGERDVQGGELIGYVGNVGNTGPAGSGYHLHIEFRINNVRQNPNNFF